MAQYMLIVGGADLDKRAGNLDFVLGRYPYALAAYADLHASLGNLDEARSYLDHALECQSSPAQRALLRRKRAALAR